jgi:hypothetical protein
MEEMANAVEVSQTFPICQCLGSLFLTLIDPIELEFSIGWQNQRNFSSRLF